MYILPPFELWFIIACTILFGLAFVAWTRKDWLNMFFKIVFFVLTIWGVVILYDQHLF